MERLTNSLLLKTVTDIDIVEVARMWNFEKGSISLAEAKNAIVYMQDNHKKNHLGHIHHLCFAVKRVKIELLDGADLMELVQMETYKYFI